MKHGKRPTVRQRRQMEALHLNSDNWLVCKDTPEEMVLEHKFTGNERVIRKGEKDGRK
ncbi:MAG: hypothetical protein IJD36_04590 [Clostridia bacterium]|nr:hypothetical protein [Clostridia bacterium]